MTAFLIGKIAPLMFVALVIVLLIGYPVSFALGAVGILQYRKRNVVVSSRQQEWPSGADVRR